MADWQDVTELWTATAGSWSGSAWVPANPGIYTLALGVDGAWNASYRPTQLRVTFTGAEAEGLSTYLKTAGGSALNTTTQLWTGFDVDSDLSFGSDDFTEITFAAMDSFTVTKIELYGDEIDTGEAEEMPYSGPYRMFTRNYDTSDINYVYDWEYDHLAAAYASGNDEVSMRCMRLFEMETVSGDTKVGMLLFTDDDTTDRQTGTVIDSTDYLFNKDTGISLDTITAADNCLFIFEKNPTDLSGGTDESDFPPYLRKYIEYAVLERAYAVDNDGQIASLRDYWAMRKTIGLKAIKLFMGLRKADRNYRMTTKGTPGFRTRREPRLPDAYPAVYR